ncbi:hypothetical protein B0H11DRAFT_1902365 [Mycena galericulata]|nr:hypothetical protein B0H11DRAFT_1902365 [Mycena galericulata]
MVRFCTDVRWGDSGAITGHLLTLVAGIFSPNCSSTEMQICSMKSADISLMDNHRHLRDIFKWSGRNARFIIISGVPGCSGDGKFSAPRLDALERIAQVKTPARSSIRPGSINTIGGKLLRLINRIITATAGVETPFPCPSLNWRSVKTLFPSPTTSPEPTAVAGKEAEAPRISFTPECEVGLAALNDVDDADESDGLTGSFASKTLDLRRDGVDITLPFFRDLLADKPVDGADAIRSLSEWSAGGAVDGEKGKKTAGKTAWDGEADKLEF